ncbi:MAG: TlpA family protein disulfide reductase [Anaerolineales bacterium]|jgi:peroxiredoxin
MAKYTKNKLRKSNKKSPLPLILVGVGLIVIAFAFVLLIPRTEDKASSAAAPGEIPASIPGEMNYSAPSLELTDLRDQSVSLADYQGQWVLVNNWATWCPPCRAEMPELNAYYEAHKDDGFVLIGISSGDTKDQIEDFIEEYGLSFPMWQDPTSASLRAFRMDYLPSSFVIDPSGTVRLAWTGAVSLDTLETYVTPLLND